ncbi:hypothetical protein V2J09_008356 [Rumex salicifolius]
MEQSKEYTQYYHDQVGQGNGDLNPVSERFMQDATNCINMETKPHEFSLPESKPVHFSIQTGEEFALEFMRPRKPAPLKAVGDPNYATGYSYMELNGLLGITRTESESGSDVSMLTLIEKGPKDFERKNSSLYEEQNRHGSIASMQRKPSGYESGEGIFYGYSSSVTSGSLSTKMKILCSFGGKILPRPSDGKLRYVGGETRIIRINKDITWNELKQKTMGIFSEAHTIKYQLPGEDLDALVSVSSDEDLQNMMEECNTMGDGDDSKKLRLFLFTSSDLEHAHYSLNSVDADTEIRYVVAVNGMNLGSRKSSVNDLASSSANNLDELSSLNVDKGIARSAAGLGGASSLPLTEIPSSKSTTFQTSQPAISSSDSLPLHVQGQVMQHEGAYYQLSYGHDFTPSSHYPYGEMSMPTSTQAMMGNQGLFTDMLQHGELKSRDSFNLASEVVVKEEGTTQQEVKPENQPSMNSQHVPIKSCDGERVNSVAEIAPASGSSTLLSKEFHGLPPKIERKHQNSTQGTSTSDAVKMAQAPLPRTVYDSSLHAQGNAISPECSNLESESFYVNHAEPPVSLQRYHSERIPRDQLELLKLNRISKSDDSLNSQLLVSCSPSGVQKDLVKDSTNKLHNLNPVNQFGETLFAGKPLHTDDQVIYSDAAAAGEKLAMPSGNVPHTEVNLALLNPDVESNSVGGDSQNPETMKAEIAGQKLLGTDTGLSQKGDILIDINDRFPRDFLTDIFSKAILSEESPSLGTLQQDGLGYSMNVENHDAKNWSFFQKIAKDDFPRKDVSLIDQDHLVYPSRLAEVDEEAPISYQFSPLTTDRVSSSNVDSHIINGEYIKGLVGTVEMNHVESHLDCSASQAKGSEGLEFRGMTEILRSPYSEDEGLTNQDVKNVGLPPLDPSGVDINSLQMIKNDDLEELKELGSGTFGTVYHGKWRGTDVAIKRFKKSCFTGRSSEQERLTLEFWREADILSKLHHPNVVAFYGVVKDGPGNTLATVTEYMVDGSLRHVLIRKDRHLDRRKRLIIAMDAAFGMEYLHSKNIVHFDLKCDNLLVNLKDPSRPICKVGDFGLSKIKRNTLVSGGVRGTLPWMAPELLNGSSSKVSEKVDVFSFGIVLWEILTGEEPYANMHYGAIIGGIVNNTLRPLIPSYCDPEWRRLMEECWAPNPSIRPSFTEIADRLRIMTAACQTKGPAQKASH